MTDEPIDEAKLDEAIKRAGQYWYGKRDAEIAYVIHCIKIIRAERDALAAANTRLKTENEGMRERLINRAACDLLLDALNAELKHGETRTWRAPNGLTIVWSHTKDEVLP